MTTAELPWAHWPWQRCRAYRERRTTFHGRCELRKEHAGAHALERGMDVPRWSTDWVPARDADKYGRRM